MYLWHYVTCVLVPVPHKPEQTVKHSIVGSLPQFLLLVSPMLGSLTRLFTADIGGACWDFLI